MDALEKIYSCLVATHFLAVRQLSSVSSVAQVLIDISSTGNNSVSDDGSSSDYAFRHLLTKIVRTTIELQNELRVMYLPTAQRCHYVFTLTDLTMVFRWVSISCIFTYIVFGELLA